MACKFCYAFSPLPHSSGTSSKSLFKSLAPQFPVQRHFSAFSSSAHPQSPSENSTTFSTSAKSIFTWDDVLRISEKTQQSDLSGFFDKISACNRNVDKQIEFLPFVIESQIVGFVHNRWTDVKANVDWGLGFVGWRKTEVQTDGFVSKCHSFADILRKYQDVFVFAPGGIVKGPSSGYVTLQAALRTPEERTNAVGSVIRSLGEDVIPGIRNEFKLWNKRVFLTREGRCSIFWNKGLWSPDEWIYERNGEEFLWVGKRSQEKTTFPGRLDCFVAGGLPHGIACSENVIKECEEEAGIPRSIAKCAKAVGAVSYSDIDGYCYKRDVLFCYDLKLPEEFIPNNQDGEVESFKLIPVSRVMNVIKQTNFYKSNCCLVIIDFLIRHGYIAPDDAGYLKLIQRLRSGDCS